MYQFINEADDNEGEGRINMDDPVMQKTGWSKDNPDLTVGGVLKQGEKHPEYKAAKAIVDKEKGRDSGEDDAGKLSGKSDFSRDGGDEPDPIGDKGDVPVGELPDRSSELPKKTAKQQSDFEKKRDAMFKKARGGDTSTDGGADEPKTGDSESEDLNKVQSVDDVADIEDLRSDFDFGQRFDAVKDEDSGYKDEYDRPMSIDDLDFKVKMINAGEDPQDFIGPFEDEDALAKAWKEATSKAMASKKETININGKKYREVKEDRADGKKLVGYSFAGKVYKNKDDAPVSDPTPVYESKKSKTHILKENYERFFGEK